MLKDNKLTLATKLLIYQYKEQYPCLDCEDISSMFCIPIGYIKLLFKEEYLIIPSKLNK
jgi:hypothetical protein